MLKKIGLLMGAMTVMSMSLSAAPVVCSSVSTLTTLIGLTDGCYDQDKLYTDFYYNGGGTVTSDSVFVVIGTSTPSPTVDQHTVTVTTPGGWTDNFGFGYNITLYNPRSPLALTSAALDINAPDIGGVPNTSSVEKILTDGNGVAYMLNATQGSGGSVSGFNTQTLGVAAAITVANGTVTSVSDTYFQTVVPEPGTYALLGAGLLALGFLKRRK